MLFLQIIAILAPEVAERSCSLSHYIEWTGVRIVHLKFRVESLELRVFVFRFIEGSSKDTLPGTRQRPILPRGQ